MINKKRIIAIAVFLISLGVFRVPAYSNENIPKLLVFHSPACHRCLEVKKEVLPKIEVEYRGRIIIEYYDLTDIKNYKFLLGLKDRYNLDIKELYLPVFFMQGKFLNSKADLKNDLRKLIEGCLSNPRNGRNAVEADLTAHFKGFKPLAIIGAGLVDGINPCAFTVIVFFISYLALQGYRKRELVIIGLSFISAVFVTYSLIGLGIFNFLYRMQSFWLFAKIFNISVGIFSIILGIFALYDLFKFRETKDTEGLILQLPKAIKNRIHSVIGLHYRKEGDKQRTSLIKLVFSALITGFLVSILEAVCTGQLYLPTIAFILKTAPFKLQAFGYLVIYNIMFILPLFIIFLLALFGVTSGQFANFLKKHLSGIKIIMAILFFSLGIFLIWRG